MWSKRPHQEDRSQISDCQNFKVSPVVTDLISEDNEGDLYIPGGVDSLRGMMKNGLCCSPSSFLPFLLINRRFKIPRIMKKVSEYSYICRQPSSSSKNHDMKIMNGEPT